MKRFSSRPQRPGQSQARRNRHTAPDGRVARLSESELYERLETAREPLLLILDGVQDPHNLGACLRTADASGAMAVVTPKHHACSVTETVSRIACGAAEHVPVVAVTNLARAMQTIRDKGVRIVGTADEADQDLYACDLSGPLALVMGAEGEGMRRLTGENCDELIRIPMMGHVECLNVSTATAVCLFEAVRQRTAGSA